MKKLIASALALALCTSLALPALAVGTFADVPADHNFYDSIMWASSKGIVGGYDDGTFQPAKTVTRSNFCVMLSRAFYPDDIAGNNTERNLQYGRFGPNYMTLMNNYILLGTPLEASYALTQSSIMNAGINRYEMAQLMTNIMTQKGFAANSGDRQNAISKITDYSSIPGQYRDAVANVYALGIIGGYADGSFHGDGLMNRGQAAVVIYRMMQYSGNQKPTSAPEVPVDPVSPSDPTPTGKTLVDGSEITEANVMRLMEAKVAEWGQKAWGNPYPATTNVYPQGSGGDVAKAVNQYIADGTVGSRVSCTGGCGGWATYLCDAAFGNRNFPMRKTTFENMRAGDIILYLTDGKIGHIAIASGIITPVSIGGQYTNYNGVYGTSAGQIPSHSSREFHANSSRVLNYDSTSGGSIVIYTRYPD